MQDNVYDTLTELASQMQDLADERFEEMRKARTEGNKEKAAELRGEVLGLLTAVNMARFEAKHS